MFFAVAGFGQFSFGVQAIGNLSSAGLKNQYNIDFSKTMKLVPGGGVVVQYDFTEKLAVRSGINYLRHRVILKGTIEESAGLKTKSDNRLHYLQVPLTVQYSIPFGNAKLYAGAGGYINYGTGGTSKQITSYTMPDGNEAVTVEKLKAFKKGEDDGAGFKRVDLGATALAGIRLKNGMFANIGYQLGLSNIAGGEGNKYKNHGLQLSAGYFF
jgi:Outer membrane protein beta-barrel domain